MVNIYVIVSGVIFAFLGIIWSRSSFLNLLIKLALLILAAMAAYLAINLKMLG